MTVATRNGCQLCVAMHTARLTTLGAGPALIAALRDAQPLADPRLDAIRLFALRVLDTAGDVGDQALGDFLAAGYTAQNALEVVLGIGTYTMSTLANRLTGAPVDDQLAAYAWELSCSMTPNDGEARVSSERDEFAIRFHLHPTVRATRLTDGHGVVLMTANKEVWTFGAHHDRVELEDSVYLAGSEGPRRTV